MTADHLQPVLDTARDTSIFFQFATVLARGQAPAAAVEGVRMGRITALKKPNGGIRGIVVGDILRRLVARTMAKQMAARVEAATAPFQNALTTKAGCESVAHILQSLTDQDERATIVSIDGVGAYDLISRNAMLEGLATVPEGDRLLPFVRHFYGSPSAYLWEDEAGETHLIPQGEGGEQGDPLMPMLFSLGMHPALMAAQERLRPAERIFAFWTTCASCVTRKGWKQLSASSQRSCGHTLRSKCMMEKPKFGTELERSLPACTSSPSRRFDPDAVVWRGDVGLDPSQEREDQSSGLKPIGVSRRVCEDSVARHGN